MNKEIELVDLVDSSGNIQRRSIPRSETDLHPDLHLQIIIGIVFDEKGRILVQKRAQTKQVNPGDVDLVCGGILSGETPEEAFIRESQEETGVRPGSLMVIAKGVNKYNRYRYLVIGESNDEHIQADPNEVEWVQFIHPDELRQKYESGELTFVDEFFEDTNLAIQSKIG